MATESFRVSTVISATPEQLYNAWLDSRQHGEFTGAPATVEAGVGGKFTAWDGYISGTTLELSPGRRIVQAWRTTDFSAEDPDSQLVITFEPAESGTRIVLEHLDAPIGQGYEEGWEKHYFAPMRAHFGAPTAAKPARKVTAKKKPAAKKPAAKKAKPVAKKAAKKAKPAAKKAAAKKKPAAKKSAKKARPAAKKSAKKKPAAKKSAKKARPAAKKSAKKPKPAAKKKTKSRKK